MRSARALALTLTLAALPARADGPSPLRYDLRTDAAIIGASAALWLGGELLQDRLAPLHCRFCGANALDAWARSKLVASDEKTPRLASDLLAFVVLPAGVAAHQLLAARAAGDTGAGARDVLFVAEAASVALTLNQVVKLAVGRQRPFVRYGNYEEADRRHDSDDNLGFYSGHTTLAFSMAAAAGTVSTLRGYRSAPWVWAVGMTLATAVGYTRIASDRHYLTDALVGAAVGTGLGVGLPLWLHGREDRPAGEGARSAGARVVPLPLGVLVLF